MIYIIVTCALHLYLLTVRHGIDFREALRQGVGSAVAFSMTGVVIWPVLALLSYHLRVRWDCPRISLHHDTYTTFSYSFLTSQRSNRFVGPKIYSAVLVYDIRYRSGTRLTRRLLLALRRQIRFHMGGGTGILLMSSADQLASLGWMATALLPKTRGRLTQGF